MDQNRLVQDQALASGFKTRPNQGQKFWKIFPWIPDKEINVTKIQIKMNKIIHYSKKKVPANAKENAGELLIKCNLEEMKKWSYIQISEIFDSQGNLKGHFKQMKGKIKSSNANDPGSRVDLIRGVVF